MAGSREYCSIGKSVIIQAVGTKQAYSDGIRKVYVCSPETCKGCSHYKNKECNKSGEAYCFSCSNKSNVPVDRNIRINEKNRYGKRDRLSLNAIKMLLYFHFSEKIDSCGLISGVLLSDLENDLNIKIKTVRNVLNELSKKDYISFTPTHNGRRDIFLIEYRHYAKSANEGGRGYVVFNRASFDTLLDIKDINLARIFLRTYMELDDVNVDAEHYVSRVERTIDDIRRELPTYMRNSLVKGLISKMNSLTTVAASFKDVLTSIVSLDIDISLYGKKTRSSVVKESEKHLTYFVNEVNRCIDAYNSDPDEVPFIWSEYISSLENHNKVELSELNIDKLAFKVDWFSLGQLRTALLKVVTRMNKKDYGDNPILDVVPYIHTILTENNKNKEIYEVAL